MNVKTVTFEQWQNGNPQNPKDIALLHNAFLVIPENAPWTSDEKHSFNRLPQAGVVMQIELVLSMGVKEFLLRKV